MTEQNRHQPFRPGMNASVEIQTNTVLNVISLPIKAVTLREDSIKAKSNKKEDSQEEVVFIHKNGKVKMQKVKTGIQNELYYEIKEGVNLEDEVVVAPYTAISRKLKDKTKVEKTDKEMLTDKDE
jgi:HlyD family secretion protein